MLNLEFRVWKDSQGEWLWTLRRVDDKQPIAVSGKLYPDYDSCLDAINLVKSSIDAPIVRDY